MKKETLESRIIAVLTQANQRPLSPQELAGTLQLRGKQRGTLDSVLNTMVLSGHIVCIRKGRYALGAEADLVTGKLVVVRSGNGFVDPPEKKPGQSSVFVPAREMGTALPGDTVVVRLNPDAPETGMGPSGKIIRVVERGRHDIVGTLRTTGRFLHVVPLAPVYGQSFYVADTSGAKVGDRVLMRFVNWDNKHVSPEGEIIEVIGRADDPSTDTLSIIRQHHLADEFPVDVLQEAESVSERMELPGKRLDLRQDLIITIDPERSRDFDDALSLQIDGDFRILGVHIADVSHFVTPDSALDREAYARGTSVYLPDKVLPMLPEQLSNGICSLNPNKDRLAFSVMMRVDAKGQITERWFAKSIICSKARLTYADALAVLESRTTENPAVTRDVKTLLKGLHALAQQWRRARFAKFALDLDVPEVDITTDGGGVMTGITRSENDVSHQLVEECMVAANEAVAAELAARHIPGVARFHAEPKEEKLEELTAMLISMGYKPGDLRHRRNFSTFLKSVKDDPLAHHVYVAVLKSMNRAVYSANETGHYGLAKTYYSHFTSPIRRYPDLVAHRILGACLKASGGERYTKAQLETISLHATQREETADLAERDLTEIMKFRYLEQELKGGERKVYDAVVVTVTNYGVFVELMELQIQGMVHVSELSNDFLRYDRAKGTLSNRDVTIAPGAPIRVHVIEVDFDARRLTFGVAPTEDAEPAGDKKKQRRQASPRAETPPESGRRQRRPRS